MEDDPEVRALFVSFLSHAGYHVIESPNGADAMDLVSRHGLHIDLLLTDVVMPRAGGPTLAAALAVRQPSLKVIYISGFPP
ncbi:MAG: response regulator, partial [Vicinamibacterales bacterium]